MKTFEYLEKIHNEQNVESWSLISLGKDGWELVAVCIRSTSQGTYFYYYFKREILK